MIDVKRIDVRGLLARISPILLRISLGIVFVWFGLLKVVSRSAVGGLVATTVPFVDSAWFVPALGALEISIGLAFATGRFLRAVLPVFAIHLLGTFLVLILLPEVAFEQGNPLMLTIVGEFVVKNLVLLSAGLVVASGASVPPRIRTTSERRPSGTTVRRRTAIASMLIPLALVAAACASDGSTGAASADGSAIAVRDYEFDPGTLTAHVGDTVTWLWEGDAPHDVVGDGFRSPEQTSGTFRHTFDEPGTYGYACTIHPGMEGEVIVEER
jgi:putative oxidoreductase